MMNWSSLRNNWLKFKTSGELLIILDKSMENTSNERKTEISQHVTGRPWKHEDFDRLCPKIFPEIG